MVEKKPKKSTPKKWDKESVIEEAKKYGNVRAFSKGSSGAYHYAQRENLLDLFTWFKNPKIIHSKEKSLEVAKQYTTRWEFHRDHPYLYVAARRKGYLKEFTWLKPGPPPREPDIWTKEAVINKAKEYIGLGYRKFSLENRGAVHAASKNGWLPELNFLEKYANIDLSKPLWLVYSYEVDGKYVYVGLTRDPKGRFGVHKRGKKDPLRNFCIENNLGVPDPIIKKTGLNASEASALEDELKNEYKNAGWTVLNKAKTGINFSSLGGGVRKWTRDKCLEVALQCKTKVEMRNRFPSAYERAKKQGWLSDYTHFIKPDESSNFVGIALYDGSGNLIRTYESRKAALEDTKYTNLDRALVGKVKPKSGNIWKYQRDVLDENGEVKKKIDV